MVPDSDDDGFGDSDFDDDLPRRDKSNEPPATSGPRARDPTTERDPLQEPSETGKEGQEKNIWDFLDSSPPVIRRTTQAARPKPASTSRTRRALDDEVWSVPGSSPARPPRDALVPPSTPPRNGPGRPPSAGIEVLLDQQPIDRSQFRVTSDAPFPPDDVSKSYVRVPEVSPFSSPLSSPPSSLSATPRHRPLPHRQSSPPSPPRRLSLPPQSPPRNLSQSPPPRLPLAPPPRTQTTQVTKPTTTSEDDDLEIVRQTNVQLERSLRPRKPIQQHPYLLENVKYTTFMKSHGVKPVKVAVETAIAKTRAQEEDSQNQEFEGEESQEASNALSKETDESVTLLMDEDFGLDELAPSPSPEKTSPAGIHLRPSSQPTDANNTPPSTFSDDDDDLPSLERLVREPQNERVRRLKRQSSGLMSARRKRQNRLPDSSQASSPPRQPKAPLDIWSLSSSPVANQPRNFEPSQILGNSSPVRTLRFPFGPLSPTRPVENGTADAPVLIGEGSESDSGSLLGGYASGADAAVLVDEASEGPSESDSSSSVDRSAIGADAVRRHVRRIRGVLPASWLRLDQDAHRKAVQPERRSSEPEPIPAPRRGVAMPRTSTSTRHVSTQFPFEFDDSDDEPPQTEAKLSKAPAATAPPIAIHQDFDDGSSLEEEDFIDRMLPGRKRQPGSPGAFRATKRQKKDPLTGRPKTRQPMITDVLSRSRGTTGAARSGKALPKPRRKDGMLSTRSKPRKRAATPPRLSILDVMGPEAPRFVKLAARAVRKKHNLGRTSPSQKIIRLASRADNIDVLSALRDWTSGKTRQKTNIKPSQPRTTRPALEEVSSNDRPRSLLQQPSGLVRHNSLGSLASTDLQEKSKTPSTHSTGKPPQRRGLQPSHAPEFAPAQLETADVRLDRSHLTAHKRSLDAFYRARNVAPSLDGFSDIVLSPTRPPQQPQSASLERPLTGAAPPRANAKSRVRKTRAPRHVDPEAPQYTRANDPLPVEITIVEDPPEQGLEVGDRLRGLGPFGAQSTHDFEVFPLDAGTFFHESTLIGRGDLRKAASLGHSDALHHQKASVTFALDGLTMRWGEWKDSTSSEFGIIIDWITEKLCAENMPADGNLRIVEAADFVLRYFLGSFSVPNDDSEKAFLSRTLEVFSGLVARFQSTDWSKKPRLLKEAHLGAAVRLLVAVLAVLSLSKAPRNDPIQTLKIETLLRNLSVVTVKGLLSCGLDEIRDLYGHLQISSFRERGIRSSQTLANFWVVVIRALESAEIPRSSFWDVTHSVMLAPQIVSGCDAQVFERLWQDMFTLLPLGEVDIDGVLVPGLRRSSPLEGWALPQRLLRRIFELYNSKTRQPPGFNEYCRALIARCHYLVQQWGWIKSTGIIGVIFDFFGSQGLSNLRNEEVYRSPRFLDELGQSPSLSLEPEDRCFHIFVKLLALSIQRLKHLGRQNDIRNLVTRTLPNHDRQLLKENTVHQHDLGALRNHHDLLCTLFWAAPPEMRPSAHLVEKLVVAGAAHKEACLFNLRAWSQLARFVASYDRTGTELRPFIAWSSNVFGQLLDQYLSAASDIEQQFRALACEMPGISVDVRDKMIAKNKATAMDLLHFSMKASLDVLRATVSFEAMLGALNIGQLQKAFTALDFQSPDFDWSVLRVAVVTLEHFFKQIDEASEEQYSSGESDKVDSQLLEDALLLFNEKLAKDFFWMGRSIIGLPVKKKGDTESEQSLCAEKTVSLAARIAARFIKDGMTVCIFWLVVGVDNLANLFHSNCRPSSARGDIVSSQTYQASWPPRNDDTCLSSSPSSSRTTSLISRTLAPAAFSASGCSLLPSPSTILDTNITSPRSSCTRTSASWSASTSRSAYPPTTAPTSTSSPAPCTLCAKSCARPTHPKLPASSAPNTTRTSSWSCSA